MKFLPVLSGNFLLSILAMTVLAGPAMAQKTDDSNAAPHRALYDIRLTSTKSGSQIIDIRGQMLYEFQPSCEGWISNHRFNLNYIYADMDPVAITSDFSTFESFDNRNFSFTAQRRQNGDLIEDLRGHATLDSAGTGKAIYTLPDGLKFDLPENSVFPMGHTKLALKSLREGKKFFNAVIFDGSDQDGPVDVNAIVEKKADVSTFVKPAKAIDAALLKSPARLLRLAFFPLKDSQESSDYEMDVVFHENGIISHMTIDYGDFSIEQTLVALEPAKSLCAEDHKP